MAENFIKRTWIVIMAVAAMAATSATVGHAEDGIDKAKAEAFDVRMFVTAEIPSDENTTNYSFRLGVKYRHRTGDFDSSGFCSHVVAEDAGNEMRFGCGVDCDGGGIGVALSKDDKSAIIRLERVRIWQNNKPDEEAGDSLVAGADDKIFRLDRIDTRECASLVGPTARDSRR